jgi:hypothetical protein
MLSEEAQKEGMEGSTTVVNLVFLPVSILLYLA